HWSNYVSKNEVVLITGDSSHIEKAAQEVTKETTEPYQESLFDVGPDEQVGYRVPIACQVAGITYRQLDYWARTNLVNPSIRTARGSGSQRLYSFRDVLVLKIVTRLLDAATSLQPIRLAVASLLVLGVTEISELPLVSHGIPVYECRSNDAVIDLLAGGQGVFGIAIPGIMKDLSGTISS